MNSEFVFRIIRPELSRNDLCIAGLAIVLLVAIMGLMAPIIAKDPYETNMAERLKLSSAEHLFGTDQLGRDLFSRIIYGARTSLIVAVTISALSMMIGCLIGAVSGYFGGIIDDLTLY